MKISVVGPVYPYRGGIARFTTSLCRELAAAGHQVQTISFKRQYPSWMYPGESDKDPSLVHEQVPAIYVLDPFYLWTWFQAARQIADFAPDLVIVQWWTTFWSPAFGSFRAVLSSLRIPVVFCIHNVMPHEKRLPDVWLTRFALSKGNAFITLSPKESERLAQLLPGARIFTTHLPVPHVAEPSLERSTGRQQLGIPADSLVLLFFGIIRPYKGLHVLLNALSLLRSKNLFPKLIVAGEFWEDVKSYQQQIESLGLSEQVIIENRYVPDEEMANLFTISDAFVAPYIRGTQSAAIRMAMGYGLPILASDQISGDLPVGRYPIQMHPAGDAASLAESIRNFFEQGQPISRQQTGTDDWADVLECVEQVCQSVSRCR